MTEPAIRGLVFDKDGTLYDFNATWGAWAHGLFEAETGGDPARMAALAGALDYDLGTRRFGPGSVVIAHTAEETAEAILPHLPPQPKAGLVARMNDRAATAPQVEASDLREVLGALRALGLTLGVATNDGEAPARAHLTASGVLDLFDFVAGYDSGYGAKPGPGQLLGFCAATGLAPETCLMVGDSTHDLFAGRAAGMGTVGVLTGPALAAELAPHADAVLPSIAALPDWLSARAVA